MSTKAKMSTSAHKSKAKGKSKKSIKSKSMSPKGKSKKRPTKNMVGGNDKLYKYRDATKFMKDFAAKKIGFPAKRLYYTDADVKKMFGNLSSVKFDGQLVYKHYNIHNIPIASHKLTYLGRPLILLSRPSDYKDFNILTDMFHEENRMYCTFFSALSSPMEYFETQTRLLATNTLRNQQVITPHTLREELYNSVKECSSFRPSNLVYIIQLFGAKSVLDPCSGWGDRLMAAMATGVRYVGVDPNKRLPDAYKRMISFMMPAAKRKNYTMIESTIQEAKLPDEDFDLVFTSPPYFKIEKYSNKGEVMDTTSGEWFANFMVPMMTKTTDHLNNGGHMVLVINQLPGEHYIQDMIKYVYNNMRNMHYLGVIAYANRKVSNPQPMFIWQKSIKIPVALYNPSMVVTTHNIKVPGAKQSITVNVFRDDYLTGGTKQRAIVPLIESSNKNKFIYAGPTQGMAIVALAYSCYLTHKTAVLFVARSRRPQHRTKMLQLALTFGNAVELHEMHDGQLKKLQIAAEAYHKAHKDSYLMSFGGNSGDFMKLLERGIREAMPPKIIKSPPKRIWITAGSATVLNVLARIFPKTQFLALQVGKTVWPDMVPKGTIIYTANQRYAEEARDLPPWDAQRNYEAKLYEWIKRFGRTGDYVYNIAGNPYLR
jgi:16S rRNA G966 N2-methylase RsmD